MFFVVIVGLHLAKNVSFERLFVHRSTVPGPAAVDGDPVPAALADRSAELHGEQTGRRLSR